MRREELAELAKMHGIDLANVELTNAELEAVVGGKDVLTGGGGGGGGGVGRGGRGGRGGSRSSFDGSKVFSGGSSSRRF